MRPPRDHRDALKRRALDLIGKIENKDRYAIFLQPVDVDDIPGYADVISRPMDLSTVRTNVTVGVYRTPDDLRADLDLIWANCIKFNADDSIYYREAVRLRALAGKYFEEFLRNLARDGLPYGPRKSGAAQHQTALPVGGNPSASTQLVKPASAVSLKATAQRLRITARARRKSSEALDSSRALGSAEPGSGNDPVSLFPDEAQKKGQIFAGPYQLLRRFPNAPGAAAFPYVRGTVLQQRLQPFPPAWEALGRWHRLHQQQSNFMSEERDIEMYYARRYQDYVTKAAPVARRLLATILDPFAVLEHDAAIANKTFPTSNLTAGPADRIPNSTPGVDENTDAALREVVDIENGNGKTEPELTSSPKKRPRHGYFQGLNGGLKGPGGLSTPVLKKSASVECQPVKPLSPGAVQDLREMLKAHKIDDSFLTSILKSSNSFNSNGNGPSLTACVARVEKQPDSDSIAPMDVDMKSSSPRKQAGNEADGTEKSAFLASSGNHATSLKQRRNVPTENGGSVQPSDTANAQEGLQGIEQESGSDDESDSASDDSGNSEDGSGDGSDDGSDDGSGESSHGGSDEEDNSDAEEEVEEQSQWSDADLSELLSMNHATLLNIMRIRALKESATGAARKDLNAREEKYAAALRDGVALAAAKVPPNLLIPQEKAAELALEAARQSIQRRDRKRKRAEVATEKAKAVAAAPNPAAAVPAAAARTAGGSRTTPAVVAPVVRAELKARQDFVVKKLSPADVVKSGPTASALPNKKSK